jgi:hypothetical protein
MKSFRFFSLFLLLIFAIAGCKEEAKEMQYAIQPDPITKGPVTVSVKLQHKSLSILGQQRLCLTIEAPKDFNIDSPALEERLEDFRRIPWRASDNDIVGDKKIIKKYFAFELYESGEQIIPPFKIYYSSNDGEKTLEGSLKTQVIPFEILPVDGEKYMNASLKPMSDLARPVPFNWLKMLGIVFVTLLFIALCFFAYMRFFYKVNKPIPPPIPAHLLAYNELKVIVEQHESGELDTENFVNQLCNVLRRYIERRFSIRAYEQTTEEFLDDVLKIKSDIQNHREVLQKFLEYTDLIKFANKKADKTDVQKGFDFIKDFIEKTKIMGGVQA